MKRGLLSISALWACLSASTAHAQLSPTSTYEDVVISTQLACATDPRAPGTEIPITISLLYTKRTNGVYCLPAMSTYGETTPAIKAAELAAKAVTAGQGEEAIDFLKSKLEFSQFGLLEHAIGDIYALDPDLHDPSQADVWRLYARTLNPSLCIKHYQRYRDGDSLNPPDTALAQIALEDGAVRGSGLCARTLVEIWEARLPGYLISDEDALIMAMLSTLNGQAQGAEPLRRILNRLSELQISPTLRSTARRAKKSMDGKSDPDAQRRALESHMFGRFDTGYIPMEFYYAMGLREAGMREQALAVFNTVEGRTAAAASREAAKIERALVAERNAKRAEEAAAKQKALMERKAREWTAYEARQAQYEREKAEYDRKMALWRAAKARKAAEEKRRAAERSRYYSTYSSNRSTYSSTASRTYSSSPSSSRQTQPARRPQSDPTNNWHTKFWQNHNNQMNNYYKTGQFNNYW